MTPLIVDLPYPSLNNVKKNLRFARLISPLYASAHGELNAILGYSYYATNFENYFSEETAKILKRIAVAEMEHLEILANLLTKLGQDPVYGYYSPLGFEYYQTSSLSYSKTPQKMLLDAISGEMIAINDYLETANKIEEENVSAILIRIRLDEELHVKILKELLEKQC